MKGFAFAGIHAGIKKNDQKDLGLIYCKTPAVAAALFTRNKVVAAPVALGKKKLEKGLCSAVLVNSGNANCFTGEKGIKDAGACSKMTALSLGIQEEHVIVSSTGVIGQTLPMDRFEKGVPEIVRHLSENNAADFAEAILTTDTFPKTITRTFELNNKSFSILGIAKGSGMIRPDMATMLAFICTDVDITADVLKECLTRANEPSFNRISVDGDTSTNDTLLVLANGTSGVTINSADTTAGFQKALNEICYDLARMVVKDGEGATKVIEIIVKGALTREDAFKASEAIAHSNLVKTAIYGEDPNWGRITAAAGRSGAHVVQEKMDLFFDEEALVQNGCFLGEAAEKKAARIMKQDELTLTLDLNLGKEKDRFLFCDFSENYVKINADYRS